MIQERHDGQQQETLAYQLIDEFSFFNYWSEEDENPLRESYEFFRKRNTPGGIALGLAARLLEAERLAAQSQNGGLTASELKRVVTKGEFKGKTIPHNLPGRTPIDYDTFRGRCLELAVFCPEALDLILDQEVTGTHYTGSLGLVPILQHGLRPRDFLSETNLPFANGHLDSASNDLYVSFDQWQATGFRHFFWSEFDTGYTFIQPLNEENITLAIENSRQKHAQFIKMHREHWGGEAEEIESVHSLRFKALENMQNFLQDIQASDLPDWQKQIYTLNFPMMVLISKPDNWIIPHSDIRTEYMVKGGVGVDRIKALLVPGENMALAQKAVDSYGLQDQIAVLNLDEWRKSLDKGQ